MRAKHKNHVTSKRATKTVARKTRSKLATLRALPGRTTRFVKSNPVRVILGAAAVGVVVAKLKHFI
jgi:ElaB/YqjD/DUF883 family membrane-anchored ribosome-binding protein